MEDRFTIVIWQDEVDIPDDAYGACANGEVSLYEGVVQIKLDDDWELTFETPDYSNEEDVPGPY